ncbi:ubiquilin-1-like [Hylaeus volcanicus]|uniref:ubiquilin-1-like n=1 Tax=Hylaeus volcanicus TaxID=313075 RepID=UPI0023B7DA5F|nr:ubiquilin-1-like [Hylaeus volcanicus]
MDISDSNRNNCEQSNSLTSIIVHLTLYNIDNPSDCHVPYCESIVSDLETSITKGLTVAKLKEALESQDLIPNNFDNQFILQVRLDSAHGRCVEDDQIIQESIKDIFITLKPKQVASSVANQSRKTPPTETYQNLLLDQHAPFNFQNPLETLTNDFPKHTSNPTELITSFDCNIGQRHDLHPMSFTDPSVMQDVMNSPMMRSLMSNPEIFRTLLDSNPQIRQLREQHPELNYLLNDSELLQQSMQAMQNPSLMQEMISNTDRVLNNIDAVPGGFNALRRVYQSIQEPIWDVSFGSGPQKNDEPRDYQLKTSDYPSTKAIPNPWAKNRHTPPKCSTASMSDCRQQGNSFRLATSDVPSEQTTFPNSCPTSLETIPSIQPLTLSPSSQNLNRLENSLSSSPAKVVPDSTGASSDSKTTSLQTTSHSISSPHPTTETPIQEPVSSESVPLVYPSIFNASQGLRSLGGFGLSPHIQGIVRTPKKEEKKNEEASLQEEKNDGVSLTKKKESQH